MRMRSFLILVSSLLMAWPARAESRGELLYSTHCIACHSTQMHWRDNRAANDWVGLTGQVRRWQSTASLAWSDADILEVARFLNDSIYHFEQPAQPQSSLAPPRGGRPTVQARGLNPRD